MYITQDRLNYMDVIICPEPTRSNKSIISFGEEISAIFSDHQIFALKYVIVNTIDCTCCSIIIVVSMLVFSLFFSYGAAFAVVVCDDISKPYPLPRIGYVKRYLIRQRPYFITDFLIRSIIRTRMFNDYLGSLTNTPVVQRLPQPFNDYNGTESYNPPKTHKTPPQNCLQRGSFMSLNSRKALFQAVFGYRKSPP